MNTFAQTQPTLDLSSIVDTAIEHCSTFTSLLEQENKALTTKDMSNMEELTKQKRHLAAKLEVAMTNLKTNQQQIKASGALSLNMQQLQVHIDMYKEAARKNVMLLKASHEATTSVINMIRRAVSAHTPKAQTYGSNGQMAETDATTLVNKSI